MATDAAETAKALHALADQSVVATVPAPASGALLNPASPTLTGTAPPNSTVTVVDGTKPVCTATADAMGNWSCTPSALGSVPVSSAVLRELERVHQLQIATHLEKDLKSTKVLREIRRS